MSILNVNQIQPVGGGNTITVNASDVSASGATITATSFVGPVTGNVTGNLTGNVTGNVTSSSTSTFSSGINVTGGRVLIGTTNAGSNGTADDLVVANNASASDQAGITIRGGTSGRSQIFFSDGTSGEDEYRGMLRYDHSDNSMQIRTNAVERLRIASDGVITINTVPATNNNANQAVLFQTAAGAIHGGSGLLYNPAEDVLKVNGNIISSQSFFGAGAGPLMLAVANYSSTQYIKVSNKIEIKGNVGINEANPAVSLDLASNTDAVSLPTGTTAQRPSGTDAYIRKNSTNNALEFYNGTNWVEIITDYFPTGSTTLG